MGDDATVIEGQRVRLRKARDADAEGLIELLTDERVRRLLGGPRPEADVRAAFESAGAAAIWSAPGTYVVASAESDDMLGSVTLNRRSADLPGHVQGGGGELELTYLFRPHAWGHGYAREAARTLLRHAATELPDQPVLIITQTANAASLRLAEGLGFRTVDAFELHDAEQALATAQLHSFRTE